MQPSKLHTLLCKRTYGPLRFPHLLARIGQSANGVGAVQIEHRFPHVTTVTEKEKELVKSARSRVVLRTIPVSQRLEDQVVQMCLMTERLVVHPDRPKHINARQIRIARLM